jgi:hypothetical protein
LRKTLLDARVRGHDRKERSKLSAASKDRVSRS